LPPLDVYGFDIAAANAPEGIHIIGFSLGAMTAIKVAAQRPNSVTKMTLIAPAAPLELGNFLPHMAGGPVFKMAMRGDFLFKVFTSLQRLGVAAAHNKILQIMFDGSPQADLALLSDPGFRAELLTGLKESLGPFNRSYRAAVRAYVEPWAHYIQNIKCPVTIHHGKDDNWAPIEMSFAIEKVIASDVDIITYDGLGHYAVLHRALPHLL
jgi:pimeloyl-ACP methyl ester carboxylesterase